MQDERDGSLSPGCPARVDPRRSACWRSSCSARCAASGRYGLVTEIAVALLGVVLVVLLVAKHRPKGVTFYGAFADDAFSRFMKALWR